MKSMDKTLDYHELLMTLDDTSKYGNYELLNGFHYEFYKDGDINEWINIHIKSGEFNSEEYGIIIFPDFYDSFINELHKRCLFVVNDKNEKVSTITISKLKEKEYGYDVVLLFGLLYHLLEEDERIKCISEVKRVLKNNGLVFVSYIPYLSGSIAILDRYFRHPEQVDINNLEKVF